MMKVIVLAALLAVGLSQTTPIPTTLAPVAVGTPATTTALPVVANQTQPGVTPQPAIVTPQPGVTPQPAIVTPQPGVTPQTGNISQPSGISSNMSWAPILGSRGNMSHVREWTTDLFDAFADKDFASFMQVMDEDTKIKVHGDIPIQGEYEGEEIWDLIFKCEGMMEAQSRPNIQILSVDDIRGISLVLMNKNVRLINSGKQAQLPLMFLVRWSVATGKVQEIEAWLQDDKQFLEASRTNAEKSFWRMINQFSSQRKIDLNQQNLGRIFADNIEIQLFDSSNLLSQSRFSGKQGVISMFQELANKFGLSQADISNLQQSSMSGGMGNFTRRQQPGETKDLQTNATQPVVPVATTTQPAVPVSTTAQPVVPVSTTAQPVVPVSTTAQPVVPVVNATQPNISQPQPVLEPMGGQQQQQQKGKFQELQTLRQMKLLTELYHNRQYEIIGSSDTALLIRWKIPEGKMLNEDLKGLTRFTYSPEGLLSKVEVSMITPLRPWQLRPMPEIVFPQGQQGQQQGQQGGLQGGQQGGLQGGQQGGLQGGQQGGLQGGQQGGLQGGQQTNPPGGV